MRFRYYFVVQDAQGNVISNAAVSVYLAGTTTPAVVYATRTSSQGSNTPPQLYSRENGSVVFWLDSDDYNYGQLFDIVVQKDDFSFSLNDVQIIVWDAVNADMVDGYHASQTPVPNVIVPLNANGILDLSATYVKSNVYSFRRVDLTNATSDYFLQVGEEAIINFTNATSVLLRIATQSGTYYEMDVVISNNVGNQNLPSQAISLYPNNAGYPNDFVYRYHWINEYSHGYTAGITSSFRLGEVYSSIRAYIINYTTAKIVYYFTVNWGNVVLGLMCGVTSWQNTTILWTSLGTIIFPQPTSGYVIVRRLA
jgi:hypothetical protein